MRDDTYDGRGSIDEGEATRWYDSEDGKERLAQATEHFRRDWLDAEKDGGDVANRDRPR